MYLRYTDRDLLVFIGSTALEALKAFERIEHVVAFLTENGGKQGLVNNGFSEEDATLIADTYQQLGTLVQVFRGERAGFHNPQDVAAEVRRILGPTTYV